MINKIKQNKATTNWYCLARVCSLSWFLSSFSIVFLVKTTRLF